MSAIFTTQQTKSDVPSRADSDCNGVGIILDRIIDECQTTESSDSQFCKNLVMCMNVCHSDEHGEDGSKSTENGSKSTEENEAPMLHLSTYPILADSRST